MPLLINYLKSKPKELDFIDEDSCLWIFVYSTGQYIKETTAPTIPPARPTSHSLSRAVS